MIGLFYHDLGSMALNLPESIGADPILGANGTTLKLDTLGGVLEDRFSSKIYTLGKALVDNWTYATVQHRERSRRQ